MLKIKKCDFCNKTEFKTLFFERDHKYKFPVKFRVVECNNCGLIFINPRPSFQELKKHYPKEYYSFKKIDLKENSEKTRFKLFLYDLYFNPKNKKYLLKLLLSPFLPYLRGTKITPNAKLLDVGCGSGQFIYEMRQFGIDVYGIEPGEFDELGARKIGLKIRKSDLIAASYKKNYFDMITINHVLEHLSDPSEIIKEMYHILKRGGLLIIGVPNKRSLAYWLFKNNWYQLDIPRHLHDFSDSILIKKLKKEGFKIKRVRHNSRPKQFSTSLRYLLRLNSTGNFLKIIDVIFLPLTYITNFLRIGDQIEIYCTK